jgi:hypothetical protein
MRIFNVGREKMIRHLLNAYNVKYAIMIYDLVTYSPIENIITLLGCKFGLSKTAILIILAFLL